MSDAAATPMLDESLRPRADTSPLRPDDPAGVTVLDHARRRPARDRDERGVAALSLLVVAMLLGLAIFTAMALPLTNASDAKAKSRSAADAAALAGVEAFKEDLVEALRNLQAFPVGGLLAVVQSVDLGGGQSAAIEYARRNDGTLVTYIPRPAVSGLLSFETFAKVRGRSIDGEQNYSEARAKLDLPGCDLTESVPDIELSSYEVTPSVARADDEGDDGEEEEEEEPKPSFSLECDGVSIFKDVTDLGDLGSGGLNPLIDLIDRSNARLIE